MTYRFPEELGVLRTWLAGHGLNLATVLTDRQAAFHAQKLAGTYLKFPPKGHPCRALLLDVQAAVVKNSERRRTTTTNKPKRGRVAV